MESGFGGSGRSMTLYFLPACLEVPAAASELPGDDRGASEAALRVSGEEGAEVVATLHFLEGGIFWRGFTAMVLAGDPLACGGDFFADGRLAGMLLANSKG
jgi:hypothetical protein